MFKEIEANVKLGLFIAEENCAMVLIKLVEFRHINILAAWLTIAQPQLVTGMSLRYSYVNGVVSTTCPDLC